MRVGVTGEGTGGHTHPFAPLLSGDTVLGAKTR